MSLTGGMPGVSGELNVNGVPTRPRRANEPGLVPSRSVDGLSPSGGNVNGVAVVEVDMRRGSGSDRGGRGVRGRQASLPYAGVAGPGSKGVLSDRRRPATPSEFRISA